MPSVYAHDHFGLRVYRQLDTRLQKIIKNYTREFRAGLQGPDFLYFYNPVTDNSLVRMGMEIHKAPAREFMERALPIVRMQGLESCEGAYIMGMVCHFILDSSCHGYVDEMIEATGESHNEIETEFERFLMEMDGRDPVTFPVGYLIDCHPVLAETISEFYDVSTAQVKVCQKRMRMIKHLLTGQNSVKRVMLEGLMRFSGRYEEIAGHYITPQENLKCVESSQGLYRLFLDAVPDCVDAIESFVGAVVDYQPLSERFDRNFCR